MRNRNYQIFSFALVTFFLGYLTLHENLTKDSIDLDPVKEQRLERSENILSTRGNRFITDFEHAKKKAKEIYKTQSIDFYCNCPFRGGSVLTSQCNYEPQDDAQRARRIEWEHIVPASQFGRSFTAWKNGHSDCHSNSGKNFRGRKCARKVSKEFRMMEADLYNLVPAIGEVNMRRGNLAMKILDSHEQTQIACELKIGETGVEPSDSLKGFIARTYLYMEYAYPNRNILDKKMKEQMLSWHHKFPRTSAEKARAASIAHIQGNINPYIQEEASVALGTNE